MTQVQTPDLCNLAEAILDDVFARFPLEKRPAIQWKNLRVSAGIAYYKTCIIGLSKPILTDEKRLRTTLLHEYAHLLAYQRHGRKAANHGIYWQQAMADLGLPPIVRHLYECERNTARQEVEYRCKRCGAAILRTRRLPSRRRYVHASCGGALQLAAVRRKV